MEYQSDKGIHHYTKLGITNWSDMKTRAIAVSKLYVNFLYSLRFLFFYLAAILFFKFFSKFVRTVHKNFHATSGLCNSRNEWVMLNFAIWRPYCFLAAILFSKNKNQNSFRLSIHTSMRNLDSVAQEMSELCSILRFGGHFVFQKFFKICSDYPYELSCEIWTL